MDLFRRLYGHPKRKPQPELSPEEHLETLRHEAEEARKARDKAFTEARLAAPSDKPAAVAAYNTRVEEYKLQCAAYEKLRKLLLRAQQRDRQRRDHMHLAELEQRLRASSGPGGGATVEDMEETHESLQEHYDEMGEQVSAAARPLEDDVPLAAPGVMSSEAEQRMVAEFDAMCAEADRLEVVASPEKPLTLDDFPPVPVHTPHTPPQSSGRVYGGKAAVTPVRLGEQATATTSVVAKPLDFSAI